MGESGVGGAGRPRARRHLGRVLLGLAVLLTLGAAGFGALVARGAEPGGIDELWLALLGPADFAPVEFEALRRVPGDALAARPGVAPLAPADLAPPVWAASGPRVAEALTEAAAAEGLETVFIERGALSLRFVARSPVLRLPSGIEARVVEAGPDRASVALYARAALPLADRGATLARLRALLARLDGALPRG